MIHLQEALIRIETDLRALGLRWALVGGLAVSARSEPRTTDDLDLAVVVANDLEAEEAARGLRGRGYRDNPQGALLEQTDVGRLASLRLVSPILTSRPVGIDLLFASSGIEPEIIAAAEIKEALPGVFLPVATLSHLLALKVLAGRLKDKVDAQTLLRYAQPGDLERAREALHLIDRRGFHRDKDLFGDFASIARA